MTKVAIYKYAFLGLLVIAIISALYLGAYDFTETHPKIISTYLQTNEHSSDSYVLIELRIPRILMAIFTGAGLAELPQGPYFLQQ
jgi:ABC-type Fe3+-siderophore transport system permease subunit